MRNKKKTNQRKILLLCTDRFWSTFKKKVMIYPSTNKYRKYFRRFGNIELISCLDTTIHEGDLLVLPGGQDINPIRYGEKPDFECGSPNLAYEWFDVNMMQKYIDSGIPIVGVCRGLQSLAVHYGAKLSQHQDNLPRSIELSKYMHSGNGYRGKIVEKLVFEPQFKYLNKFPTGINSLHHQSLFSIDNCPDILPIAKSDKAGNIELISVKNKNILAFQGHMEELQDSKLFDYLIKETINRNVEKW